MQFDEAGERQRKRPRTQGAADFSASATGDDIAEASDSEESADSFLSSVASSHPQPQSRVLRVDPAPGLDILNLIQSTNASLLAHLSSLETPAGVRAKEVALGESKGITELRDMFVDAVGKGALIQDGYAVFLKACALFSTLQGDFFPLLTVLPRALGLLVLKQDGLISDLRRCYLVSAADPSNWKEAPEIPSSSEATATPVIATSETPRIEAVGSDTMVDDNDTADSSSTICSGIYV